MSEKSLPGTGYRLLKLFAFEQFCKLVDPDEVDASVSDRATSFYWNWFPSGTREFSVWVGAILHPSQSVPESVRVAFVGDFAIETNEPDIPFDVFVTQDAPSLIFPYVREAVSSLTGRGIGGVHYFPPFDYHKFLGTEISFADSTGVQQLRDPEQAAAFGFPVKLPRRSRKNPSPRKAR